MSDTSETTVTIGANQAQELAKVWMSKHYSDMKIQNPDGYYARLGFLIDFVTDLTSQPLQPLFSNDDFDTPPLSNGTNDSERG